MGDSGLFWVWKYLKIYLILITDNKIDCNLIFERWYVFSAARVIDTCENIFFRGTEYESSYLEWIKFEEIDCHPFLCFELMQQIAHFQLIPFQFISENMFRRSSGRSISIWVIRKTISSGARLFRVKFQLPCCMEWLAKKWHPRKRLNGERSQKLTSWKQSRKLRPNDRKRLGPFSYSRLFLNFYLSPSVWTGFETFVLNSLIFWQKWLQSSFIIFSGNVLCFYFYISVASCSRRLDIRQDAFWYNVFKLSLFIFDKFTALQIKGVNLKFFIHLYQLYNITAWCA